MATAVVPSSSRVAWAIRSFSRQLQPQKRSITCLAPSGLSSCNPLGSSSLQKPQLRHVAQTATSAQFRAPGEQPNRRQRTSAEHQQQRPLQAQAQSQESTQGVPQGVSQGTTQGPVPQQQQQGGALAARPGAGAAALSPAFADLLGPWFPGDRSLHQMLSTVDRMFEDVMAPAWPVGCAWPQALRGFGDLGRLSVRPPWDVQEDETAYHLRFDLPGTPTPASESEAPTSFCYQPPFC